MKFYSVLGYFMFQALGSQIVASGPGTAASPGNSWKSKRRGLTPSALNQTMCDICALALEIQPAQGQPYILGIRGASDLHQNKPCR